MKNIRLAGVAGSFVVAVVLAACSGGDDAPTAAAPATVNAPVNEAPSAPVTPAPSSTTPAPKPTGQPPIPVAPKQEDVDAGPGPAPFDPSQLADLRLWLRGDSDVQVDASNNVTKWLDRTANHNDAVPVAGAAPVGADKALTFSGAQALTIKDNATLQWKGDFTLVVVAQSVQSKGTYGALFGKTAVPYPYSGPVMFVNYPFGPSKDTGAFGIQLEGGRYVTTNEIGLDDAKPHLFYMARSSNKLAVSVDHKSQSIVDVTNIGDPTAPGVDAYIGGHPQASIIQCFQGKIFEILAVEHQVSAKEYDDLYLYANARYGIDTL